MLRRVLALPLILTMLLSACDVPSVGLPGASRNKTDAEIALERDAQSLVQTSRQIVVNNALQGAAIGGLLSGVGTAILGGDGQAIARNAAIGAAVGGAGGAAVGSAAARTNRVQAEQRQVIAQLNQTESGLRRVQQQLNAVIAQQNRELSALRGQTSSEAKARVNAINSNRTSVQRSLAKTDQQLQGTTSDLQQLQRNTGVSTRSSQAKANSMRTRIAGMQRQATPIRVTN